MISKGLVDHIARGMAWREFNPGLNRADKALWVEEYWTAYKAKALAVLKDIKAFNKGEWQQESTAPKDGTWCLLYWPTMPITQYPAVGCHHGDEYGWELINDRDYGQVFPTHWMPVPPTP